jgi:hypothetical protein
MWSVNDLCLNSLCLGIPDGNDIAKDRMMNYTIKNEEQVITELRSELGSYETLVSRDDQREALEWLTYFGSSTLPKNEDSNSLTYVRGGLTVTVTEVDDYFAV